ncbi:MFS transporter [Streptomyces sp. NPDC004609]|uniref:MFS transporter n=1 Tax=Streptomyces sp. NPDC004609 TaxID=3364704 RepID=UPI0036A09BBD
MGISILGSGLLLAIVNHSGMDVSLWALAPAFLVIGIGTGLCYTTIPTIALGNAKPEEAGSASGSLTSMQQISTAIGSAAVSSVFYGYADSGYGHAMQVTLVVVMVATALSIPFVTLMPRQAPAEPPEGEPAPEPAAA